MYYGYARVSTQGQKDTSIEVQIEYLRKQAQELKEQFEARYEKASGKSVDGRAVFKQLLLELKSGDILGVYDNSRLGRNTQENLTIVNDLFKRGIRVQISGKLIDTNNPQDELMFSIESSISTFQRKNQLMKSRAGINVKKANGDWIMRGDTYGWILTKNRGVTTATIDEEAAKKIRYIYEEYAKGRSSYSIADEMEQTQTSGFKGYSFTSCNIRRLLMKPLYMGYYTLDSGDCFKVLKMDRNTLESKLVKSNIYPPIVSEELWWKVFDSWRQIKRSRAKQYEYRWSAYELSSVLKCGYCGKGLTHSFQKSRRTVNVTETYVCTVHKHDCEKGPIRSFKMNIYNNLLRMTFFLTFKSGIEVSSFFNEKKNRLLEETVSIRNQIGAIDDLLLDNSKRRNRLLDIVEAGLSDMSDIKDRLSRLTEEKKSLETKRLNLESSIDLQQQEIEDIAFEESFNVIDSFIAADTTTRRDLYLKYIRYAKMFDEYLEVEYMNGKKFVIYHYPVKSKKVPPQKFMMYFRDELQAKGYFDGQNGEIKFDKIDSSDEFVQWANEYYIKLSTEVNSLMKISVP